MTNALGQHRPVLFQICEWGVDFPALWAPSLGQTWRIGNDIIPAWRAIFRTLNQAVPNTAFAGPHQWPDLDMLEIGTDVLTTAEEQTHFSMWAILKSPLTIGGALKDEVTSISEASLGVLRNKDVIGFNQDALGVSAKLRRRWSDEEYEVWSGPLENGRMVAALINWADEDRELTLDLPVVGVQFAGMVKDVWAGKVVENVRTGYTSTVSAHGVMLLELSNTIQAGVYSADIFATKKGYVFTTHALPLVSLTYLVVLVESLLIPSLTRLPQKQAVIQANLRQYDECQLHCFYRLLPSFGIGYRNYASIFRQPNSSEDSSTRFTPNSTIKHIFGRRIRKRNSVQLLHSNQINPNPLSHGDILRRPRILPLGIRFPDKVWRRVLQARWLQDRLSERQQPRKDCYPSQCTIS